MQIEPFELNGKTIKDCYKVIVSQSKEVVRIEFTDGTEVEFDVSWAKDSVTRAYVLCDSIEIHKA